MGKQIRREMCCLIWIGGNDPCPLPINFAYHRLFDLCELTKPENQARALLWRIASVASLMMTLNNSNIRPTNGRAEQQLRRNRSTQYFSYPDFKFDRLRKKFPGQYESYADMGLDEWITLRIEVAGGKSQALLERQQATDP